MSMLPPARPKVQNTTRFLIPVKQDSIVTLGESDGGLESPVRVEEPRIVFE